MCVIDFNFQAMCKNDGTIETCILLDLKIKENVKYNWAVEIIEMIHWIPNVLHILVLATICIRKII